MNTNTIKFFKGIRRPVKCNLISCLKDKKPWKAHEREVEYRIWPCSNCKPRSLGERKYYENISKKNKQEIVYTNINIFN